MFPPGSPRLHEGKMGVPRVGECRVQSPDMRADRRSQEYDRLPVRDPEGQGGCSGLWLVLEAWLNGTRAFYLGVKRS